MAAKVRSALSQWRRILWTAGLVAILSGCARFDLRRNLPWRPEPEGPPSNVVAFWTDALLERVSGPPYRGFGGRLFFYSNDMSRTIHVQGTLVVYAFNDDLPPPENLKPVRKFVFTSEQLATMETGSKMGPSYSVLIPWDQFSEDPEHLSLMVRLIPESGGSVISQQARVFLPGLENHHVARHQSGPQEIHDNGPNSTANDRPGSTMAGAIRPTSYVEGDPRRERATGASEADAAAKPGQPQSDTNSRRMQTLTLTLGGSGRLTNTAEPPDGSAAADRTSSSAPRTAPRANTEASMERPGESSEDAPGTARLQMSPASETPPHLNPSSWQRRGISEGMALPPTPGQMLSESGQPRSVGFRPAQYPAPAGPASLQPIDPQQMGPSLEARRFGPEY